MTTLVATVRNILRTDIEMLDTGAVAPLVVAVCRQADGSFFALQIDGEAPVSGASILVDAVKTIPGLIDYHIGAWRLAC